MRLTLKVDFSTVAELSYLDIAKLLIGREIKVPGHPVHIRQQTAYEAFNSRARPRPGRR